MDFESKRQSERKTEMNKFIKQEFPFWILLLSQFLFLFYFGEKIPSEFPTHWDFNGNPDSFSSRFTFPIISCI